MKRLLSFTSDQKGFYLPYVLFVTALILLTIVTNITRYQHDVVLTGQHLEQLQIETLMQIGNERISVDYPDSGREKLQVVYDLPYGKTTVSVLPLDEEVYNLSINVITESGAEHKTFRRVRIKQLSCKEQ